MASTEPLLGRPPAEAPFVSELAESNPPEAACPICLGNLRVHGRLHRQPLCGHEIHEICWFQWIFTSSTQDPLPCLTCMRPIEHMTIREQLEQAEEPLWAAHEKGVLVATFCLSRLLSIRKKYDEAAGLLFSFLDLKRCEDDEQLLPEVCILMASVGDELCQREQYDKGEKLLLFASDLGCPDAALHLGALHFQREQHDEAQKLLLFAYHQGCHFAALHLGFLHFKLEQHDEALKFLLFAYDQGCRAVIVHDCLGRLYRQREEYDEAEKFFRAAHEQGWRAATHALGALVFFVHKKSDEALRLLQDAHAAGFTDGPLLSLVLGQCGHEAEEQGRFAEAEELYETALRHAEDDCDASRYNFSLALCFWRHSYSLLEDAMQLRESAASKLRQLAHGMGPYAQIAGGFLTVLLLDMGETEDAGAMCRLSGNVSFLPLLVEAMRCCQDGLRPHQPQGMGCMATPHFWAVGALLSTFKRETFPVPWILDKVKLVKNVLAMSDGLKETVSRPHPSFHCVPQYLDLLSADTSRHIFELKDTDNSSIRQEELFLLQFQRSSPESKQRLHHGDLLKPCREAMEEAGCPWLLGKREVKIFVHPCQYGPALQLLEKYVPPALRERHVVVAASFRPLVLQLLEGCPAGAGKLKSEVRLGKVPLTAESEEPGTETLESDSQGGLGHQVPMQTNDVRSSMATPGEGHAQQQVPPSSPNGVAPQGEEEVQRAGFEKLYLLTFQRHSKDFHKRLHQDSRLQPLRQALEAADCRWLLEDTGLDEGHYGVKVFTHPEQYQAAMQLLQGYTAVNKLRLFPRNVLVTERFLQRVTETLQGCSGGGGALKHQVEIGEVPAFDTLQARLEEAGMELRGNGLNTKHSVHRHKVTCSDGPASTNPRRRKLNMCPSNSSQASIRELPSECGPASTHDVDVGNSQEVPDHRPSNSDDAQNQPGGAQGSNHPSQTDLHDGGTEASPGTGLQASPDQVLLSEQLLRLQSQGYVVQGPFIDGSFKHAPKKPVAASTRTCRSNPRCCGAGSEVGEIEMGM